MYTEEQYEKELKRLQRNQRQAKPVSICFIILIVAEFVVGGVLVPINYNFGMAFIALAISTLVLFGILLIIIHFEKKQLNRMQNREIYMLEENKKLQKALEEKYLEYKRKKQVSFDIDELIEYDMVDEDFDDKE